MSNKTLGFNPCTTLEVNDTCHGKNTMGENGLQQDNRAKWKETEVQL